MADAISSTYDDVPYVSIPVAASHPDCLASRAMLLGMSPVPVDKCRVLELGCATGGNLIPLAASFPDSTFLGIDFSEKQIAHARQTAAELELANVEFRLQSILDVPFDLNKFDYVIAHGVYSWVPPEVRDRLFFLCRRLLAPQGVAYVSYNTYPGWHERDAIRAMALYHARQFTDPGQRIAQTRAFLQFVGQSVVDPDKPFAKFLREEVVRLHKKLDFYIYHEFLEPVNQPVYFHEFARGFTAHGLQFLGEVNQIDALAPFPPEVRNNLLGLADGLLSLEQHVDFLTNRAFRQSLLCHGEVNLNRNLTPRMLDRFTVSSQVAPAGPNSDPASATPQRFIVEDGGSLVTDEPLVKAALLILSERWPLALSMEELWAHVCSWLGNDVDPARRESWNATILRFTLAGVVNLHLHSPPVVVVPGTCPVAWRLARYQASRGFDIVNLHHQKIDLNPLDEALLPLLDGSRDHPALVQRLLQTVNEGKLAIQEKGVPIIDQARLRDLLGEALAPSLARIGRNGLLVG